MTREAIFEKLTEVFRDVFDDEEIVLEESTNAMDIEEWDSLAQISLIVAIEQEFSIKFTMQEVTEMKNVGEMVSVLLERV